MYIVNKQCKVDLVEDSFNILNIKRIQVFNDEIQCSTMYTMKISQTNYKGEQNLQAKNNFQVTNY